MNLRYALMVDYLSNEERLSIHRVG